MNRINGLADTFVRSNLNAIAISLRISFSRYESKYRLRQIKHKFYFLIIYYFNNNKLFLLNYISHIIIRI